MLSTAIKLARSSESISEKLHWAFNGSSQFIVPHHSLIIEVARKPGPAAAAHAAMLCFPLI